MAGIQLKKQPRSGIEPEWPFARRIKVVLYQGLIPLIAYPLIRALTLSYRWRAQVPQELLELLGSGRPFAVAIWHGDMLLMQSVGRHLGFNQKVAIMVALSQAGEVEARILKMLGYHVVRGSQKRRGSEALEEMVELIGQGVIAAFVVDGPSGPPETVKAGVIRLAQRCQIPIVPVAFAPRNEWKLPTWDSTRIPKPFSRRIWVSTVPIAVPAELDGDQFEACTRRIAETLQDLKQRPVAWEQALPSHLIPKPPR
jgi:lysophospholipid acyltransferase (LPLAT)-like uncharacterized protein